MRAQLFFNTWESRYFIAKTLVKTQIIQEKLKKGIIAIGRGLTNAYILRELLEVTANEGFEVDIDNYVAGIISKNVCASHAKTRAPEVIFRNGTPDFLPMKEIIKEMGTNDVIIKGGNALDPDFIPSVLVAHPEGGTVGSFYTTAMARGIDMLVPISLEKMIPYPVNYITSGLGGQQQIDYARGLPVGLFPLVGGKVFTELDALQALRNVETYPISTGGVNEGAGGTLIEIVGKTEDIKHIINIYESVINVQPLDVNLKQCNQCTVPQCYKNIQWDND